MKTQLVAIVVGTAISLGLWLLSFHHLLREFYIANTTPYMHLAKYPAVYWAMIASSLFVVCLIAYVLSRSEGEKNFMSGMMTGAVVTFLMSASNCASFHAFWNLYARRALAVDVIVITIIGAINGGIMGWIMGMGKERVGADPCVCPIKPSLQMRG